MFVLTLLKLYLKFYAMIVIDNINKFNLATVFASIKCLYKKQDK